MQSQDVERYLSALDQALVDQGLITPMPALLLGGAYIAIEVNSRRATNDIDVFPLVEEDKDQATGIPLAVALYQATQAVAKQYNLHPFWLNTIRTGAMLPKNVTPPRRLWKKYQVLEVYLPTPEYVLIQKLLIHRLKDQQDILALLKKIGIVTRSQAQELLDRYIPQEEQLQQRLPLILRSYLPS